MQDAAGRRAETEQLQKFLKEEEGKMSGSREQVEKDLSQVQPLIEAAKKAVGGVSKASLNELRSLKMPPEPIHDVLKAVLRVFGN